MPHTTLDATTQSILNCLQGGDPLWQGRACHLVEIMADAMILHADHGRCTGDAGSFLSLLPLDALADLAEQGVIRDPQGHRVALPEIDRDADPVAQVTAQARLKPLRDYVDNLPGARGPGSEAERQHGYIRMQIEGALLAYGAAGTAREGLHGAS